MADNRKNFIGKLFSDPKKSDFNWLGSARFERGDLKLVILHLLQDKPRHGYDIIHELETRSHGFYSPSPGSVYPILQLLEDQDLVRSNQKEGKRVYTLTKQGEQYLDSHKNGSGDFHSRMKPHWWRHTGQMKQIRDEIAQTAQLVFRNAAHGALENSKKMDKIHEAFERFRKEIESIIAED